MQLVFVIKKVAAIDFKFYSYSLSVSFSKTKAPTEGEIYP